jgi:hypothetical protein
MSKTIDHLKHEAEDTLESLQALRDELRVQVHLGSMDARKRWDELEGQLMDLRAAAQDASRDSLRGLRLAYEDFRSALQQMQAKSSSARH